MHRVDLIVRPRTGVRDPQGDAVEEALRGIGYDRLKVHCVGRFLRMDLDVPTEAEARRLADEMCKRLLVNPNLETYDLKIESLG
ncbi:MAG: phosphoribosylformylglycinamidine synthase subunit PurS [Deltaproteobacteria bacterium]|nr:phosphoribosylformylglycinamidine synthase subunit PurS [Deltaproteobacteria bacterium]